LVSVFHGGFNEFFYNGSSEVTSKTLQYLEMIGATEYYEILGKAIAVHQEEMKNPVMQELYAQQSLHGKTESYKMSSLREFDRAFDNLGMRLFELKIPYIRSNPELFVGS